MAAAVMAEATATKAATTLPMTPKDRGYWKSKTHHQTTGVVVDVDVQPLDARASAEAPLVGVEPRLGCAAAWIRDPLVHRQA